MKGLFHFFNFFLFFFYFVWETKKTSGVARGRATSLRGFLCSQANKSHEFKG